MARKPKKPDGRTKPWSKKRKIVQLWKLKPGRSLAEIAEKVGSSNSYVSLVLTEAGFSPEAEQAVVREERKAEMREDRAAEKELSPATQAFLPIVSRWQGSMASFVEEALGINGATGFRMSGQQRDACDQVSALVTAKELVGYGYPVTAEQQKLSEKVGMSIMSGQGPGKDAWLSWFILWFLVCFDEVLIPCTAPTSDQLKTVLWSEVSRWLYRRDNDGNFLVIPYVRDKVMIQGDKIYIKDPSSKNFAFPKTANPKDDPDAQARTLYGYHAPYMAIIVDEAAGVLEPVFKPLEGTLTGLCNFLLLVFNPIKSTGFAVDSQIGKFSHKWLNLRWNAEESENVSKQHIKDMEEKYGRQSNTFRTLVLGLPPKADPDTLIPYDWVMAAVNRPIEVDKYDPKIGGLDPGGGGDNTALLVRHGLKVEAIEHYSSPDQMEVAYWAASLFDDHELDVLYVDVVGIGAGVYYRLKELNYNVRPVDVRNKARNEEKFANKRAELWWKAREVFQDGSISIPDNQFLKEELWSPKFEADGKRMKVESKARMKKRLEAGRSPNDADALLLTLDSPDRIYRKRRASVVDDEDDWGTPEAPNGWMAA